MGDIAAVLLVLAGVAVVGLIALVVAVISLGGFAAAIAHVYVILDHLFRRTPPPPDPSVSYSLDETREAGKEAE